MIELLNMDCMEYMKGCEDNAFDLAIVDPPYGIERFERPSGKTRFASSELMQNSGLTWDKKPPPEYFDELIRVSKGQVIWGANNFNLPATKYFCIWDKQQTVDNFASAEYAWVGQSLKKPAKVFRYGIHQHNADGFKIHPTQKPVKLYEWLLANYAKEGDRILDTHLGSGSSAIAAHYGGFDSVGMEIDEDYYNAAVKRFEAETAQLDIFG